MIRAGIVTSFSISKYEIWSHTANWPKKNPLCYTSSLYYLRVDGGKAKALVNQEYSTEQHEEHSDETENQ